MSGEIEAGTDLAKIHFVFCSPTEALHMVGNKHIHLQVPQPHTPSTETTAHPLYTLSMHIHSTNSLSHTHTHTQTPTHPNLVQIFEPLTNEVVETFPLSISAHTKFNAFRLQPSKGVTFGAVRFDSAPKTKRVELRNEGTTTTHPL